VRIQNYYVLSCFKKHNSDIHINAIYLVNLFKKRRLRQTKYVVLLKFWFTYLIPTVHATPSDWPPNLAALANTGVIDQLIVQNVLSVVHLDSVINIGPYLRQLRQLKNVALHLKNWKKRTEINNFINIYFCRYIMFHSR
jgi:hypothetical protein